MRGLQVRGPQVRGLQVRGPQVQENQKALQVSAGGKVWCVPAPRESSFMPEPWTTLTKDYSTPDLSVRFFL